MDAISQAYVNLQEQRGALNHRLVALYKDKRRVNEEIALLESQDSGFWEAMKALEPLLPPEEAKGDG